VADGEFQEFTECPGTIHVWVHTKQYKSILNCVYNPWVGDYIDPDRELDADGVPLDMYCDANTPLTVIKYVTYNTVDGYLAAGGFPYAQDTRIGINGPNSNEDSVILSVQREQPNSSNKCCCATYNSCPCDFYYASVPLSEFFLIDPDTNLSGGDFLNNITKKTFFGKKWEFLFTVDNSITERKRIGNLGVGGVDDVEVFIKNFHETARYQYSSGRVGNIAGEGKNHVPTKDYGRCDPYYPDIYNPLCNMYHGGYNVGPTNSTWTFSGSQFLSTVVPTDFINGGEKFCDIALLDKDIEYNFKNIDLNNVLIQDTTFKGKVAIQGMAIGGLNNVSVGVSYGYSPYTYTNNLTNSTYQDPGLVGGGQPQLNVYAPYTEFFFECKYAGLSDFVARPFKLKSTGIFLTPLLSVTIRHMQTKLPYCYYDTVLQKYVAYPVDPEYPSYQYMYNQTASFKPQLGSITITEL